MLRLTLWARDVERRSPPGVAKALIRALVGGGIAAMITVKLVWYGRYEVTWPREIAAVTQAALGFAAIIVGGAIAEARRERRRERLRHRPEAAGQRRNGR